MIYNIPDELAPYLEYIPDEMMGDVITDALRALIFAEPVAQPEVPAQLDISQLLEQLKSLNQSSPTVASKLESAISSASKSTTSNIITAEIKPDMEDIPDDLMDIVGDFASNAFK